MIHTQTEIDNLVELAIIQRAELKKLVESLPQLRDHLSSEIERNLEEIEPAIRSELEQFVTARALDAHVQTSTALTAKIDELARSLETTTAARYSVLIAEREKNESLLAQAEARIAEAASALPSSVKEIVAGELARFPRAGEIDQLRKEFAEPKGLNPRGKWSPDESYQRLDLVTINGDSFVSNIDGNRERPSRSAADWTLNAARGNSGGGGGVTSLTDLLPIPTSGQILGSEGTSYVPKTLVAGSNITITETPTTITITGDEGQIELTDGTEAAPSLFFVSDTNTGMYRPAADTVGIVGGGHDILRLTDVASATDYLEVKNGIGVGTPLHVLAEGASANIGVHLQPKGSGLFTISDGTDFNKGIRFRSSSSAASAVTLIDAVSTAGRVVTLPDATDTLVGRSTTDTLSNKTMIAPALGTPTALIGTNITGTAAGLTAGNVTTNANLTGDVTSVGNATSIAAGVIVDADINASAGIVDTKLATISTAGKVSNSATTATSANTASAIVARDGSGNFTANTITANLTGNVSGSSGSTTGNAATATALATGRTIAITGDLAYTSPSFDGTGNVTAAGTLATVATAGTTGSSTAIPIVTINAKGLTTSISTAAVIAPAGTLSGNTLAAGVTASSLTSLGTIASLTATAGTISTTPTASTDIANKLYVDTVAQGLDAKASCVAATTADITLSGAQTIDGVGVVAGNRVLVKNQSLSQNNGIYLCAAGAWTRATDADTWDELTSAFTFIEQGTVNGDCGFVCTANAGGTLGTTALPWSQFSGAGTFTAGTGLTLTGSVFSLTSPVAVANGGTGLTSLGSGVATFLGTPSSANLAAAVSDETGSGALVFATSPTLVTPNLGAASATSIAASGTVTGSNLSGTNTGDQTTITGNAGSATILQTARNINGVSFNGSADITVTAAAGTLTGATLASGVTASSLTSLGTIGSLVATTADINGGTIDGTTVGATTPSTVAGTTGTFSSGFITNNANSATELSITNTNTGVSARARLAFVTDLGASAFISYRRAVGDFIIGSDLNIPVSIYSNAAAVGTFTSTGLAVTGTLSATGNLTLSAANSSILGGTSTGSSSIYNSTGASGFTIYGPTHATKANQIDVFAGGLGHTFNSTGFAVSGALSATGDVTLAATSNLVANKSVLLSDGTAGTATGAIYFINDTDTGFYRAGGNTLGFMGNGASLGTWSPTSLAVTGALSSTTGANFATSSGAVGVGTASPSGKLQVVANTASAGLEDGFSVSNAVDSNCFLQCSGSAATDKRAVIGPSTGTALAFQTGASERARITSGGYFKASDTGTYAGSTATYHEFSQSVDDSCLIVAPTNASFTSSGVFIAASRAANSAYYMIRARANAVDQFYVTGNGAIYAQNTTVQSLSDGRLKENVRDAADGLNVIIALRPVRYDWKPGYGNDRKDQLGFIAQEMEAVFPEAVSKWATQQGEEAYKTVGPSALIPVLVKAIQELKAQNDDLRARVGALESN